MTAVFSQELGLLALLEPEAPPAAGAGTDARADSGSGGAAALLRRLGLLKDGKGPGTTPRKGIRQGGAQGVGAGVRAIAHDAAELPALTHSELLESLRSATAGL